MSNHHGDRPALRSSPDLPIKNPPVQVHLREIDSPVSVHVIGVTYAETRYLQMFKAARMSQALPMVVRRHTGGGLVCERSTADLPASVRWLGTAGRGSGDGDDAQDLAHEALKVFAPV